MIGRIAFTSIIAFIVVAFGQPSWVAGLAPLAAVGGYALFWWGVISLPFKKKFSWALVWYGAVQGVQLSWMTAIDYQGPLMLLAYLFFLVWLGIQFGLLSLLVKLPLTVLRILTIASGWTILEWSRLFCLCGFSWNPAGIALGTFLPSLQLASLIGVFGLSFWVFFVNGLTLKFFLDRKCFPLWVAAISFPYLFGFARLHLSEKEASSDLSVALVQTGLLPSEKIPLPGFFESFILPLDQWNAIFSYLPKESDLDLIVLPESTVPFGADLMIYPLSVVQEMLAFRGITQEQLPSLEYPYAGKRVIQEEEVWYVSNLFFVKLLAKEFQAEVIVGLDYEEKGGGRAYNSAFHVFPIEERNFRYDKRVLVPIAEYFPFKWCAKIAERYGIGEGFTQGKSPGLFLGKHSMGISICYEETFPYVMREAKRRGAELFVNVTNDAWYPFSKLSLQHYEHARVRAVENGIPLIRACNSGVTAAVDSFGGSLGLIEEVKNGEMVRGALITKVPLKTTFSLYSVWGDYFVVGTSIIILFIFALFRFRRIF